MKEISWKKIDAVLWDLDGTLVDTARIHWQAWNLFLSAYDRALSWEEFLPTFGLRNDVVIPVYIGRAFPPDEIDRMAETKEGCFREVMLRGGIDLLPGAATCLERFRALGWPQALATMTPCQNVELIMDRLSLRGYFATLVTGDDVLHGKPEPDIFLEAARRLERPPAQCLVLEDSRMGVQAARRAGMTVVALGQGVPQGEADLHVPALQDLCDLLGGRITS